MFVLEENPVFWWPVQLTVPADGEHVTVEFDMQFRLLADGEFAALIEQAAGDEGLSNATLVERVCTGQFRGINTPDGQPLPVTPENFELVKRRRGAVAAIARAYILAEVEGPEKNAGKPLAAG